MHELAIAEAIIGLALEHAQGRRVARIHVRVGHLRQVVPSALRFSFELAAQDTLAQGALLELEEVPAVGLCQPCGTESQLVEFPFSCGRCGSFALELRQGEELEIEWLELDDPPDPLRSPAGEAEANELRTTRA